MKIFNQFSCFILLILASFSWAAELPIEKIFKDIDKNISWLMSERPDKKSVLAKLGPPQLEEKNTLYYVFNDYKYALTVRFSKSKVAYVNYKVPPDTKVKVSDFMNILKAEDFILYPSSGHEKGHYLTTFLKRRNLQLIFSNNSEKKLTRVIFDEK